MPLDGDYGPSPKGWVRNQVARFEASNGAEANTLGNTGIPIVVFTTRGARTGKLRKIPVMRVEHDGSYAVVASTGGGPTNPAWYHNLVAEPHVELQDQSLRQDMTARELAGEEREVWWNRAVEVFPTYAQYARKTDRLIPVFLLEPR